MTMESFPGAPGPGPVSPQVREQVSLPAILLMVTAGVGALAQLFGVVSALMGRGQPMNIPPELANDPNMESVQRLLEFTQSSGWVFNLIPLALSGLVFVGALKMKNLESRGLAIAASIIAMLPCVGPCCCLGLPVGIYALTVLVKPEVKAAFR
jgi:hypothetical protein